MEPRMKKTDELPASPIHKLIMDPQILIAAGLSKMLLIFA